MRTKRMAAGIVLAVVFTLLFSVPSFSAEKGEIQRELLNVLYGDKGGRVSCDWDGYVDLKKQYGYRHEGIDFVLNDGAPFYSLTDGVVLNCKDPAGDGTDSAHMTTLAIYDEEHNKSVIYLHAKNFQVSTGSRVRQGDLLGYQSNQGAPQGSHVHVEVANGRRSGAYVSRNTILETDNPYPYWEEVLFQAVRLEQESLFLWKGQSTSLTVLSPAADSGKTVYWESSNPAAANVTGGTVTAVDEGNAVITAYLRDKEGNRIEKSAAECPVEVKNPTIKLNKESIRIPFGGTAVLTATVEGPDPTVTWTSATADITVKDGKVTVTDIPSMLATMRPQSVTAEANGVSAVCKIEIIPKYYFEKETYTVSAGQTIKPVIVSEGIIPPLTYKSGNPTVAVVDSNGLVKGLQAGTATISATEASGYKIKCKITVKPVITLSASSATIMKGKTYTLKATVKGGNGKKITWKSTNPSVATVTSAGKVKGIKKGTATIKAIVSGVTASCKIKVKEADAKTRAKLIYKKALEKGSFTYKENNQSYTTPAKSFLIFDIDKDGIPELIVRPFEANYTHTQAYVYTVKKNKLVYCGYYANKGMSKFHYSPKYKSIYYYWWTNGIGGTGAALIQLKKGVWSPYKWFYSSQESMYSTKMVYKIGKTGTSDAKNVSKNTYEAQTKKYLSNLKTYSYKDNTQANRNKII